MHNFENFSKEEVFEHRKNKFLQIGRERGFGKISDKESLGLSYKETSFQKIKSHLNENKLIFDLNHNNNLSQNIKFLGDVDFEEKINFEVEMTTDLNNDSIIISDTGFNEIKSKINIKGSLGDRASVETFDGNILINNKSSVDFIGNIKNNYISSDFNIISNESEMELKLNGNIKEGVYKIFSEVNNINSNDIINSKNPSMISFNSQVNIKLIESLDFESDISFTDIQIINSKK